MTQTEKKILELSRRGPRPRRVKRVTTAEVGSFGAFAKISDRPRLLSGAPDPCRQAWATGRQGSEEQNFHQAIFQNNGKRIKERAEGLNSRPPSSLGANFLRFLCLALTPCR